MKRLIISLFVYTTVVFATTIHVPADYTTIQAGIDASSNGDTVLVQSGTYTGSGNKDLEIGGKSITIISASGATSTIIDCENNGRGFLFPQEQGATLILDGFTIQNGTPNDGNDGGGILCISGNSLTIKNCIIKNNQNSGLYFSYCSPIVINCIISGNTSEWWGGGLNLDQSAAEIKNCLISGNTSPGKGGGIVVQHNSPNIVNCTITENSAPEGGGIYCYQAFPTVTNSILWNDAPEEVYFDDSFNSNSIMIAYSDIQGDSAGIGINNNGTVYWETGNIDTDPLFTDESGGDYTLQNGSPCIDAGTAFFVWQGDTLVNLSPGEYVDSDPDMGAFEYDVVSTTEDFPLTPFKFVLHQNYPNPV